MIFVWRARKETSPTRECTSELGTYSPRLAKTSGHMVLSISLSLSLSLSVSLYLSIYLSLSLSLSIYIYIYITPESLHNEKCVNFLVVVFFVVFVGLVSRTQIHTGCGCPI